jgi:pimeloyl-ACP methyl ester carboxylesterase
MQVLSSYPESQKISPKKPVLLFLHGSFHGAWCWTERFFPYFTDAGYIVVAPSWRGTGGTPAEPGVKKVRIDEHVSDLDGLLNALPDIIRRHCKEAEKALITADNQRRQLRPVVISHSFGGLAVMKYLEDYNRNKPFSGIVSMCVVPPSGMQKMTFRYLRQSLVASWRITAGFAMKRCVNDAKLCRILFFGGDKVVDENGQVIENHGISDDDLRRYQEYFGRDSAASIDLLDLSKKLPSARTTEDGKAMALSGDSMGDAELEKVPCLVIGASDDYVVDREGTIEVRNVCHRMKGKPYTIV